ncbi:HpcH/HpaI aldolase/citrate lyase family protein [Roseomonas sp. 18066]|uniref:HpcH/HpaI aldolase family protein n=1 Tax=Roseomonas sp. 18066 TaxID=2681412 RepID=UPI00135B2197|nr:aldolase/citrate lyase family protein [Roseomonas sp. 18066]
MTRRLKDKLRAGGVASMISPSYPAPGIVERLGGLGFDAAFIDCEKGSHSVERVEELARAGRAGGIPTIVRPWRHDAGLISRYLDVGADGVMAASIETPALAREVVEAVRFARHRDFDAKFVIALVETPLGLQNLPAMLEIDEVDVWQIGANDLAHHLGHPGNAAHPAVQAAVDAAIARITARGRICGVNASFRPPADLVAQGVRFLVGDVDQFIAWGAERYRAALAPA